MGDGSRPTARAPRRSSSCRRTNSTQRTGGLTRGHPRTRIGHTPNSRVDLAEQRVVEAGQRADAALAVADRALAQLADAQAALTAERLRGDGVRQQLVPAPTHVATSCGPRPGQHASTRTNCRPRQGV